jgi:NADH dehydrogenase [ubiquinone] 1 alpha subcomplex assembly factor 1
MRSYQSQAVVDNGSVNSSWPSNKLPRKNTRPFMRGLLLCVSVTVFYCLFTSADGSGSANPSGAMGQVLRTAKYDRSGNLANAVPVLVLNGKPLVWHRLDDGVMGGQSETYQDALNEQSASGNGPLIFSGTINTNGGGFASIRAPIDPLSATASGIKLNFRGDGKTYKVLLSNGKGGGPWSGSPSWQADLPTKISKSSDDPLEERVVPFTSFTPSFGGRGSSRLETEKFEFENSDMQQLGLMLSLQLSDGTPNPRETFGEPGSIFDYKLEVDDIKLVYEENNDSAHDEAR